LAVLRRVLVEIDGHQSAKILNCDDLSVERNSEGLCMGDDERALNLAGTFSLCISCCLLTLPLGDALFINLGHGEQVVAPDGGSLAGRDVAAGQLGFRAEARWSALIP
jgi:hypothetical protein